MVLSLCFVACLGWQVAPSGAAASQIVPRIGAIATTVESPLEARWKKTSKDWESARVLAREYSLTEVRDGDRAVLVDPHCLGLNSYSQYIDGIDAITDHSDPSGIVRFGGLTRRETDGIRSLFLRSAAVKEYMALEKRDNFQLQVEPAQSLQFSYGGKSIQEIYYPFPRPATPVESFLPPASEDETKSASIQLSILNAGRSQEGLVFLWLESPRSKLEEAELALWVSGLLKNEVQLLDQRLRTASQRAVDTLWRQSKPLLIGTGTDQLPLALEQSLKGSAAIGMRGQELEDFMKGARISGQRTSFSLSFSFRAGRGAQRTSTVVINVSKP